MPAAAHYRSIKRSPWGRADLQPSRPGRPDPQMARGGRALAVGCGAV